MKIAIFSDPHLGYQRFEEDSYKQAENTIVEASKVADLIICAGDIFDVRVPKLETLKRAIDIFKLSKVPIVAIAGNHERRTKELINPAQLLCASTNLILLHGNSYLFEKNNEKIQIFGLSSVPEEFAQLAVKKTLEKYQKDSNAFQILVLHQSIKELLPNQDGEELTLEFLESLPFDLMIDGHIHEQIVKLNGRFIIPGSTVITQLKKDQTKPRCFVLYDTKEKTHQFIPIACRKFEYLELSFVDSSTKEIQDKISQTIQETRSKNPNCIISIKIDGTIRSGLSSSDLLLPKYPDVFTDNRLNSQNLGQKIERILSLKQSSSSIKDQVSSLLLKKTKDKITLFSSSDLLEYLSTDAESTMTYLESTNKKQSAN